MISCQRFKQWAKKIVFMGDLGNAKLVKTANAMLGAISNMCMAEIYYWLKKGGLTDDDFQSFIQSSQNYSTALDRTTKTMIGRKFKPRKSWMPKDVGFGLDEARTMEVPRALQCPGLPDVHPGSGQRRRRV